MKKVLLTAAVMILTITSYAQEKDVTKFLGIPIDGTKAEIIAKLKDKGFTSTDYDKDILEGEFNGMNVDIHIVTNNNKVYRIMVCDHTRMNETDIKIRYNTLINQFCNNGKYSPINNSIISDEEDISYEMAVNNKRYEAAFFQTPKKPYTETINSLSEMMLKIIEDSTLTDDGRQAKELEIADKFIESSLKGTHKIVWFMISEHYGKYFITMYYDNELNRANGDDL